MRSDRLMKNPRSDRREESVETRRSYWSLLAPVLAVFARFPLLPHAVARSRDLLCRPPCIAGPYRGCASARPGTLSPPHAPDDKISARSHYVRVDCTRTSRVLIVGYSEQTSICSMQTNERVVVGGESLSREVRGHPEKCGYSWFFIVFFPPPLQLIDDYLKKGA